LWRIKHDGVCVYVWVVYALVLITSSRVYSVLLTVYTQGVVAGVDVAALFVIFVPPGVGG
jgi:hypothetical protein